jgi:hypothetical protein
MSINVKLAVESVYRLTVSGKDLICDAVGLPESTQYSFGEVGGGDVLDRTINHTPKYPHNPGEERERGERES